jgi:hypothetical protein
MLLLFDWEISEHYTRGQTFVDLEIVSERNPLGRADQTAHHAVMNRGELDPGERIR